MLISRIIDHRGIKMIWLADQLGISHSHLSRLLSGEREWSADLRREAARILMLPEEVLFLPDPVQSIERE